VINEIACSEKIIAGAMHGAIVADALRIPWVRLRFGIHGFESPATSELKWKDWMLSLNLKKLTFIDIPFFLINSVKRRSIMKDLRVTILLIYYIRRAKFYLSSENEL